MKKEIFFLTSLVFMLSSYSCLMAQDNSSPKEKDNLFGSSLYFDVGYGYGYNTGICTNYPYSAVTGKAGNRW